MNKYLSLFLLSTFFCIPILTFASPGEKRYYEIRDISEDDALFECEDLDRDEDADNVNVFCNLSHGVCLECYSFFINPINDPEGLLKNIPGIPNSECSYCNYRTGSEENPNKRIYAGYLECTLNKSRPFLERQIALTLKYPGSQVYWVETSEKAAEINDLACVLFHDLFTQTILKRLSNFSPWGLIYSLTEKIPEVHITATCFHFSDYYQSVDILKSLCRSLLDKNESRKVIYQLDDILDQLAPLFLEMYEKGLEDEWIEEFAQECTNIKTLCGEFPSIGLNESSCSIFSDHMYLMHAEDIDLNPRPDEKIKWLMAERNYKLGISFNEHLLYSHAIDALTTAIAINPKKPDYFIERAFAYFESNHLDLAIEDYLSAQELQQNPHPHNLLNHLFAVPDFYKNPANREYEIAFAKGFIKGTLHGLQENVEDLESAFISCCQSIPYSLWCFACEPIEVSQEFYYSAMELMDFLSNASCDECLGIFLPEILHLKNNWELLDHNTRGYHIGKIVGKYGLTVFLTVGSLKAYRLYQNFKYANTMMTLQTCYKSAVKQRTIVERSSKILSKMKEAIKGTIHGKIFIKNKNVAHHILQDTHCWHKVIKLTGNIEEDFKAVKILLEDLQIYSRKYLSFDPKSFPAGDPKVLRTVHDVAYKGEKIRAIFEMNIETGEKFLQNAYVWNPKI